MENRDVARILEKIADLYEIKGGEGFRVRAYRAAADQVENLPESVEELARRGGLQTISGIGKATAEKIEEILKTGTTSRYEELKAQVPEGLTDLLAIPDVGPKTAQQLYKKLGVKTLEDLEAAAREHRISSEAGFGEKTEAKILRGIESLRGKGVRLSLGVALPLAEEVMDELRKSPHVKQISEAGSLRRRKDTIGDIDLVAEVTDFDAVTDLFISLAQVRDVIETGETMISVLTTAGLRMDLRLAQPGHFGAMLHHFTGSKYHNIKLRGMARDRGLTINDFGVDRIDTGENVTPGETEEDIYRLLDLPLIPVEIREDRGEIEAAIEGRLPNLIEREDIKGDLHIHTNASHGENTIEEMARAAKSRGLSYISICDHSQTMKIVNGLNEERLLDQMEEIRKLNRRLKGFRVLSGIEVDILADGRLDTDPSVLEQLDVVVASVHSSHRQEKDQMTNRVIRAIETGLVDILGHPAGRKIGRRESSDVDIARLFDAALAHGTAMEINAGPDRLDLNDIHARMAKDRGLKLAINADAHSIPDLDNLRYGLALARRGWLEPADVLNTMTADDLLMWLAKRRTRLSLAAN